MSNYCRIRITKTTPHLDLCYPRSAEWCRPSCFVIRVIGGSDSLAGECFDVDPVLSRRDVKSLRVSDCLSVYGGISQYSNTTQAWHIDMWSPIPTEFCE